MELHTQYGTRVAVAVSEYEKLKVMAREGSEPEFRGHLPKDRDVVLYCRSGARSYHACNFLNQQGIQNVINLRGGIIAWARQGYEIAAPPQRRAGMM